MNIPVGASFASRSFNDFSARIGFGGSFERELSVSSECEWFEAVLDEDDLPCLSKDLVKSIRFLSESDAPDLDRFIDKFGTHAYRKASLGGKAVVSTVYNAMALADCGIDGEIYLDASKGICDKSGSTGNCQLVNNGTLSDQA